MNTQVVLITGGLTGIGRATAFAFAKEDAQVVVSGRRDEEGQKLVSEIRKKVRKRSSSAPMCDARKTYAT
jgi:NAD(P)-dependent dehydrogenase (short-subunit alcohol dehydrogenase family)